MIIALLLGFQGLTFSPAEFDGFTVPIPTAASEPAISKGKKVWSGMVDAPREAGYWKNVGAWTNPYFVVRTTEVNYFRAAKSENEAYNWRISDWVHDKLVQVIQRIVQAKVGERELAVIMGSAIEPFVKKDLTEVYFLACITAGNGKLYEYRFVSTKYEDIESALEALKVVSFRSKEMIEQAKDLPTGLQGQYSVGTQVVVNSPVIPRAIHRGPIEAVGWFGQIGDPKADGLYVSFNTIIPARPLVTSPNFRGARDDNFHPTATIANDDDAATIILNAITHPVLRDLRLESIRNRPLLAANNWETLQGTTAGRYVAAKQADEIVYSGYYKRASSHCGLLASRGDIKASDSSVRLEYVKPGSILAPLKYLTRGNGR